MRAAIAAATAAVLGSAGLAAIAVTQTASAATTCSVGYSVNQWSTGFTASLTVTNGTTPITGWTLSWTYTGNQALQNGWNGAWSQAGETVTVTNLSYNGSLAAGGATTLGANFSYSGTNTTPASFTCTPTGAPPTSSPPTTPPPTTPPPTTSPPTTPPPTSPPPTGTPKPHVADPFTGATQFLDPEYTAQVNAQAAADSSAVEARVANNPTAYWLDTMASIAGGGTSGRLGLQTELNDALAKASSGPVTIEIVVYDLPGRDCAALASNGEIPATAAGLTTYEQNYINPIASILTQFENTNLRVVAIIEPDSLPNVVTNVNVKPNCNTSAPFYESGTTYALNQLHAIPNVYNYMDIGHSAWLGWPSNMSITPPVYNKVVQGTTAGYASIDGFISDTANYIPTQEPLLTNPTLQVGGQPVDSANFFQFNPTFDELSYDTAMYNTLMSAGFPASKRFLVDTGRNGFGPTHPTTITSEPDVNTYVTANKIDSRPFRGDWCNINNSGIGARPADEPFGTSSPVMAYVWIKPPGYSDGDYPTSTHAHGDPHCDPAGTQTDGNGNTYPTDAIPGFDVPAGLWFPFEFQMLVKNAFPAI